MMVLVLQVVEGLFIAVVVTVVVVVVGK